MIKKIDYDYITSKIPQMEGVRAICEKLNEVVDAANSIEGVLSSFSNNHASQGSLCNMQLNARYLTDESKDENSQK